MHDPRSSGTHARVDVPVTADDRMRRPGLAKAGLLPARIDARDTIRAWRERRHVSDNDIRAVLGGAQHLVDERGCGNAP